MKYLLKLNAASAIYGLLAFIFINSLIRGEHIQGLLGVISLTVIIPWLTKTLLDCKLWFPYFVIFIVLTGFLFPNNHINDDNFGAGLIIMFFLFFYPIYILLISFVGTRLKSNFQ
ncbi:hypothetical protein [Gottfriedia luciferensis]|uniref:hypothetical protein n=1 Tax=Gottfriedia luciferensis TaxID=178774 RepID=UPI000B43D907|nr:hypothetical protein [Gottfriedia luciferensis]